MKVLHVITSISRSGGGPSRSSQGLVAAQRFAGVDAWLMTLSHGEEPWIKDVDKFINGEDFDAALAKVEPDIVHIHGIWETPLHRCAVICRRWHIPYVIAPRGMLEPWSLKQKWLKKRIARFLYQDRDLKKAAALHATAESEAEQFRALGFKNYCIISPNGVNVPDSLPPPPPQSSTSRRALFVSRMHPKKGVLELVESWARVFKKDGYHCQPQPSTSTSPHWQCELVYTLNGDEEKAYEQQVKDRILALGMSYQDKKGEIHSPTPTQNSNFILTGPLNDDAKWNAYARADLFVLPTYSENFGIVVAEALYAGVPVITTKGTPWRELGTWHCGIWCEVGVEPFVAALSKILCLSCSQLRNMGENGRRLIETKYTWKAVCDKMVAGYEEVIGGHE